MDEFARTRGADDLFDDDFTPISEPNHQTFDPQAESFRPQTQAFAPRPQVPQRGNRNHPRARGDRHLDDNARIQKSTISGRETADPNLGDAIVDSTTAAQNDINSTEPTPQQIPSQVKGPTAVRGDRTATGGTLKPKLTEDELSARLEAVKLNNAKRAEAHRLAEADEASFQQREEQASRKRQEEGQARRQMNQEREKNRLRKLGAQAGREWDEGKEEQAAKEDRGSQYRRGANGGILYDDGRGRTSGHQNGNHESNDFLERRGGYISRGRGRGDRNRGGRGRGGYSSRCGVPQVAPDPVNDFPALPTASRSEQKFSSQSAGDAEQPLSPATGGGSWADEVQAAKSPTL